MDALEEARDPLLLVLERGRHQQHPLGRRRVEAHLARRHALSPKCAQGGTWTGTLEGRQFGENNRHGKVNEETKITELNFAHSLSRVPSFVA